MKRLINEADANLFFKIVTKQTNGFYLYSDLFFTLFLQSHVGKSCIPTKFYKDGNTNFQLCSFAFVLSLAAFWRFSRLFALIYYFYIHFKIIYCTQQKWITDKHNHLHRIHWVMYNAICNEKVKQKESIES